MNKDRSYNLAITISGKLTLSSDEVASYIESANRNVANKKPGYQMITNVTGGAPVDESNFDAVFITAIRSGFHQSARKGELEGFEGLTGTQATAIMTPRGSALSEGKADE